MEQWKLLSVGTWALPSMGWVPGSFTSQTWALGKHDCAAYRRGISSSSDMVWAGPWREGGGAKKKPLKNRVWVRGSSFAAGGRGAGAPTASDRGSVGEQPPLLQPGTPACTSHGVPVALPPPPFPAPCHGHSCTKEPREVTASPTEKEGIPAVTGDLCLLLTLSEGHELRGLTPEKCWSGAAGPWLGKALSVSLTCLRCCCLGAARPQSWDSLLLPPEVAMLPAPSSQGSCGPRQAGTRDEPATATAGTPGPPSRGLRLGAWSAGSLASLSRS